MKAKTKAKLTVVMMATVALVPCLASGQALLAERTISLNAAMEMATASLERCRADGYKVTITVLNRHARTAGTRTRSRTACARRTPPSPPARRRAR